MSKQDRRAGTDRRSGADRRRTPKMHLENTYFLERRQPLVDRRAGSEFRFGWTRINRWSSAYIGVNVTEIAAP